MRAVIVFFVLSLTLSAAPPLAAKESCVPDNQTYSQGCDCVFIPFPPTTICRKSEECTRTVTCGSDGSKTVTVSCGPCK